MASVLQYGTLMLALSLPAFASPLLEERARDNLARCFDPTGTAARDVASRAAATAFCSSLLSIPVVTSAIATITPVSTVTATATTTDATETQTLSVTAQPYKRAVSIQLPNCATNFPASRLATALQSVCSLISVETSTVYITTTAPASTTTQTSLIHETTTTTSALITSPTTPPQECFTTTNGTRFCITRDTIINTYNRFGLNDVPIHLGYASVWNTPSLQACAEACVSEEYAGRCMGVFRFYEGSCAVVFLSDGTTPQPAGSGNDMAILQVV